MRSKAKSSREATVRLRIVWKTTRGEHVRGGEINLTSIQSIHTRAHTNTHTKAYTRYGSLNATIIRNNYDFKPTSSKHKISIGLPRLNEIAKLRTAKACQEIISK